MLQVRRLGSEIHVFLGVRMWTDEQKGQEDVGEGRTAEGVC